jgi:lysophospholipase
MERWPNGKLELIRGAKHDVLTELPEIAGDVMDEICELFSSTKVDA